MRKYARYARNSSILRADDFQNVHGQGGDEGPGRAAMATEEAEEDWRVEFQGSRSRGAATPASSSGRGASLEHVTRIHTEV